MLELETKGIKKVEKKTVNFYSTEVGMGIDIEGAELLASFNNLFGFNRKDEGGFLLDYFMYESGDSYIESIDEHGRPSQLWLCWEKKLDYKKYKETGELKWFAEGRILHIRQYNRELNQSTWIDLDIDFQTGRRKHSRGIGPKFVAQAALKAGLNHFLNNKKGAK